MQTYRLWTWTVVFPNSTSLWSECCPDIRSSSAPVNQKFYTNFLQYFRPFRKPRVRCPLKHFMHRQNKKDHRYLFTTYSSTYVHVYPLATRDAMHCKIYFYQTALTLLVERQEGHPACKKWGMVEVGTGYSGWSGAQTYGLCVCLC